MTDTHFFHTGGTGQLAVSSERDNNMGVCGLPLVRWLWAVVSGKRDITLASQRFVTVGAKGQ